MTSSHQMFPQASNFQINKSIFTTGSVNVTYHGTHPGAMIQVLVFGMLTYLIFNQIKMYQNFQFQMFSSVLLQVNILLDERTHWRNSRELFQHKL
ncbi:hypothetical protein BT96DRAFT_217365 [Gymnopus androsaceus JB14]|uniref:Transmembrane protein n=1 Tax=Gymnopus androsaceus JB14 TaxID=1447944 RepID=A0A6A4H6U0_9AGAR|nr:hypothetical protein BT96DRAFT_217365 [Gymnopus androsaceus JB14]